ncbi:MAG: flagellar basal-body MS-ring/collar protein FliF [Novosphingobium sp.]
MSEVLPTAVPASGSMLGVLTDANAGTPLERLRSFGAQPAVKKTIPWFIGAAALGGVALTWSMLSSGTQRTLYSQLDDSERASVVAALDKAAIAYAIDNSTGAITVGEGDLYKARMTVAQDGALATPDSGDDMLNNLPIGASRTLEGERLRGAKERELMLTIAEIDGVESVRVHLAQGEKSAFIRDNAPPSASVMVRLARGRQLSDNQVAAITNLVASSVPGLGVDQVKVVDQHGRLLTQHAGNADSDRLELQTRMEEKLRGQLASLLTPMIGEGNFSSQIQVELDMDQVTSARESYEKQGALRSETQQQSQSTSTAGAAQGVPGVLSNTPPPATTAQPGAPGQATVQQGAAPGAAAAGAPQANGESSATRNYELGREVAVSNTTPGKLKRVSVAVALSAEAMKGAKAGDADQIKQLVSAAIGADPARGDQVAVVVRKFDKVAEEGVPFYEASWFADVLRYGVGLLGVLLVLLLGVRPLIKAFRPDKPALGESIDGAASDGPSLSGLGTPPIPAMAGSIASNDPELLSKQVSLAQRMVEEQPESAVIALRKMLQANTMEPAR